MTEDGEQKTECRNFAILKIMIRDVTDLVVYKNSLRLLRPVYRLAGLIPEQHRKLRGQIIESTESIPPLIAEGFAKKRSVAEPKRFFEIALGSSDEAITHLREVKILSETVHRIKPETCGALIEKYKIISKQLNKLIQNWVTFRKK